jgi:ADP-heptose:LPS heptosyltransferase
MRRVKKFINQIDEPPFKKKLLVIKTNHLNSHSPKPKFLEQFVKLLRRHLMLYMSFQSKYLNNEIRKNQKNILWIHNTTDNIGDSLMKTSSIRYLKSQGYSVDLCVPERFYDLYRNNSYCHNVIRLDSLPNNHKNYDLVMLDALSSKCLKIKMRYFNSLPFITLYGYFNYYRADYNLILFSWYRVQYLLNHNEQIDKIAKPIVGELVDDKISNLRLNHSFIAIICGGVDDYRTYNKWNKVLSIIDKKESEALPVVLIGSDNGTECANKIISQFNDRKNLINAVGKYTLSETKSIISCCKLVVGPDGGLLQIANALDKKIIALFAQIDCRLRFTEATDYKCLYDERSVNNIAAENISKEIGNAIKM